MIKTKPFLSQLAKKKIPTFIGLSILIVALIFGTIFIGKGSGVFAPRATPETTPKNIRITNVTDRNFTVSFLTDAESEGFVKYGEEIKKQDTRINDNRDQLSGTIGKYRLHYITIRGIEAGKKYYFLVGSGDNTYDNNGSPFEITTAPKTGTPPPARTITGSVVTPSGTPADGSVVYVVGSNMSEMSALVSTSGSWAIPLSDARDSNGTYVEMKDEDQITVFAQGPTINQSVTTTVIIEKANPLDELMLSTNDMPKASPPVEKSGDEKAKESSDNNIDKKSQDAGEDKTSSESAKVKDDLPIETTTKKDADEEKKKFPGMRDQSASTELGEALKTKVNDEPEENKVVNINDDDGQVVTTTNPVIEGKLKPNTKVKVIINSDTSIESNIITSDDGSFEIDLSQFEESLEPGEHTVTFEYLDENGEVKSVTKTFYVQPNPSSNQTQNTTLADSTKSSSSSGGSSGSSGSSGGSGNSSNNSGSSNKKSSTPKNNQPYSSSNPYPAESNKPSTPPSSSSKPPSSKKPKSSVSPKPSSSPSTSSKGGVASESTLPKTGAVGSTFALIFGGLFFIVSGFWSFWSSKQLVNRE